MSRVEERAAATFKNTVTVDSKTLYARGYTATTPSVITKWPAATALGDGAAKTLTIAQLLSGIMSSDPAGNRTFTLPTAALAVAGVEGVAIGDCIDFSIISLATAAANETITLAADTGGSVVGNAAIMSPNVGDNEFSPGVAMWRLRFTGVASGSEAFICYRIG